MMTLTSGWRSVRTSSRDRGGGSSPPSLKTCGSVSSDTVIAFRIDDAEAVALQDQLFADQSGEPGLASPRLAGDQDRSTARQPAPRRSPSAWCPSSRRRRPICAADRAVAGATDARCIPRRLPGLRLRSPRRPRSRSARGCPSRPPRRLRMHPAGRGRFRHRRFQPYCESRAATRRAPRAAGGFGDGLRQHRISRSRLKMIASGCSSRRIASRIRRRIFRGGFDDRLADGDVDSEAFDFLTTAGLRAAADSDQPPVRRKREDRAVFAD